MSQFSATLSNGERKAWLISVALYTVVFMGSKKYAGENTFDSFLSKHGGHSNASTDYEKVYIQYIKMTENHKDIF